MGLTTTPQPLFYNVKKTEILVEKAYLGELSHSEIAEITGLPLGTIKSRIRLALEKLRHSMM